MAGVIIASRVAFTIVGDDGRDVSREAGTHTVTAQTWERIRALLPVAVSAGLIVTQAVQTEEAPHAEKPARAERSKK